MTWQSALIAGVIGVSVLSAPAHASPLKGTAMTPQEPTLAYSQKISAADVLSISGVRVGKNGTRTGYTTSDYLRDVIEIHNSNACLLWPFQIGIGGYGIASVYDETRGRWWSIKAHRLAFKIVHGHWPKPMGLHRCNTRACVNPRHIYEGTSQDNYNDQVACGSYVHGEKFAHAKLTDELVLQAREEYAKGNVEFKTLAKQYGVSYAAMRAAVIGLGWSHVPGAVAPIKRKNLRDSCRNGHAYTPENTRIAKTGWRVCIECARRGDRERKRAKRALRSSL